MIYPFVSFVIPTLNAGSFLNNCLKSIKKQNYPADKIEILIVDGGSTDKTLQIAKKFKAIILKNPYKDAESGKSIGIQKARGEIIGLVDADNELVEEFWLQKMVQPLMNDKNIFGVESPWYIRKNDPSINQYVTLLVIADPVARRLHPKMKVDDLEEYIVYRMKIGQTPVIGANGFLWRKKFIKIIDKYIPKFEEVNYVSLMVDKGYFSYARVKGVGIYHYYCTSLGSYVRKRLKIGRKFMMRKQKKQNTWVDQSKGSHFFSAILFNISFILPLLEALREYRKTKNAAWLWHPFISLITVVIYSYAFVEAKTMQLLRK